MLSDGAPCVMFYVMAVVALASKSSEPIHSQYNYFTDKPVPWGLIFDALKAEGWPQQPLRYEVWKQRAIEVAPLKLLFDTNLLQGFPSSNFNKSHLATALGASIPCIQPWPSITLERTRGWIRDLERRGFLSYKGKIR